ncbi:type 1 fimbrial protein [Klebsiella michiganensis]|uniref:fimbrial protein n=1 Tax=Klebsiella TaxID=570 RepID=UPI00147383CB|nr:MULTISPECIES: type 1 fimbrial protein [Klebsiella]NMD82943.1 type 1 fimbrial protein [Klebsiella sp. DNRA6]NRE84623.1 type 1 fimbrial protein [Klebsiella michiganensis]WND13042.1 type 1 fimbrial protein [Klebsiella pasteurii]WND13049.1 type 1 fimbrial protein [Klebsiella pasteurii]
MKWNRAGWLLALALAASSPAGQAADVTVTVNGKVVARPCTIDTPKATVELGDLYTFNMLSPGAASDWHDVTLDLSRCPPGTSRVTATFSGTADATGYYKNLGTAGRLQLELQDTGGTRFNTGTAKTVAVDETTQSARFPLRVRALTVSGRPTQGTIQAVINVTYTWL